MRQVIPIVIILMLSLIYPRDAFCVDTDGINWQEIADAALNLRDSVRNAVRTSDDTYVANLQSASVDALVSAALLGGGAWLTFNQKLLQPLTSEKDRKVLATYQFPSNKTMRVPEPFPHKGTYSKLVPPGYEYQEALVAAESERTKGKPNTYIQSNLTGTLGTIEQVELRSYSRWQLKVINGLRAGGRFLERLTGVTFLATGTAAAIVTIGELVTNSSTYYSLRTSSKDKLDELTEYLNRIAAYASAASELGPIDNVLQ